MRSLLDALEAWYAEQCDGVWEHQYGIKIDTLDNPGWTVDIDVVGTKLSGSSFPEAAEDRSEQDWIRCSAGDGRFKGRGGPRNLAEILERFLAWAKALD